MKFLISLVVLMMLSNPIPLNNAGKLDTLNGYVYAIDNEYMYIETEDGNGWVLDNDGTLQVEDRLFIIFDDMRTPDDIYDDEIISITIMN